MTNNEIRLRIYEGLRETWKRTASLDSFDQDCFDDRLNELYKMIIKDPDEDETTNEEMYERFKEMVKEGVVESVDRIILKTEPKK
jgi:hypothetical protein